MALSSIEVDNLACERGGRSIFRGLSFSLRAGMVLALEGANGAGKTSALRVLAGLLPAAGGTVRLMRNAGGALDDAEERGRFIGWLGHHDGIKAQLTVIENARFFAALYASSADSAAVLARVGLGRVHALPGQYLSAGQRRRLGLARLIMAARPLWLLDEPLSALDVAGKALAASLISEHCGGGGIVIAATHEPLGLDAQRLQMGNA